jgi:hypothetical protein
MEEEAKLVNHLKSVAHYGYGYSRMEVVDLDMYYALDPVSESLFWNTKSC